MCGVCEGESLAVIKHFFGKKMHLKYTTIVLDETKVASDLKFICVKDIKSFIYLRVLLVEILFKMSRKF